MYVLSNEGIVNYTERDLTPEQIHEMYVACSVYAQCVLNHRPVMIELHVARSVENSEHDVQVTGRLFVKTNRIVYTSSFCAFLMYGDMPDGECLYVVTEWTEEDGKYLFA